MVRKLASLEAAAAAAAVSVVAAAAAAAASSGLSRETEKRPQSSMPASVVISISTSQKYEYVSIADEIAKAVSPTSPTKKSMRSPRRLVLPRLRRPRPWPRWSICRTVTQST